LEISGLGASDCAMSGAAGEKKAVGGGGPDIVVEADAPWDTEVKAGPSSASMLLKPISASCCTRTRRAQSLDLAFGQAHMFYPEASETRCTFALLLDLNPVELVRGSEKGGSGLLDQYVSPMRPRPSCRLQSHVACAQPWAGAASNFLSSPGRRSRWRRWSRLCRCAASLSMRSLSNHAMVTSGAALCVPGNHDVKFIRWLNGRNVQLTHGLDASAEQMVRESAAFRDQMNAFLDKLVSHLWLDDGRLVVAHAGIRADMIGRSSGAVREFCLYGETTGETNEYGLPVRQTGRRTMRARPPSSTARRSWFRRSG
jgi:hypothetical protein